MLTSIALGLTFVIGASLGRVLDARYQAAMQEQRESSSTRASLRLDPPLETSRQQRTREAVERFSGVSGAPVFSLERWLPLSPVVRDGVDLSNLLVQEFVLRSSETSSFEFKRLALSVRWPNESSFFEVGFGEGKNGALVVRLTKSMVALMFRSVSGRYVDVSRADMESAEGCDRYRIEIDAGRAAVHCGVRELVSTDGTAFVQGRVFATTNLSRADVSAFSLTGMTGETESEESL